MLKRIRPFRAIQARRISTASSPYDNYTKLRAFPFNLSPFEAQRFLAPLASVTCSNFRKVWPSIGAFTLPFVNFDFFRPARFSAVYFPAWIVTGEVEASVIYKGVQVKGSAWFDNTYFPGSHMAVLSTAPLTISSLIEKETVPFTTRLLHQHGEPVQCIPFSTSPFSVLDIAASYLPSHSIMINEDLSIDPSSVKSKLISAYPVLLPLYLAQYELGDEQNSGNMFTFLLKAYEFPPSADYIMTENLSKIKIDSVVKRAIEMFNHESSGDVHPFFHECPRVSMPFISHRSAIRKSINEWLEDSLRSSRNIEILAEHSLGVIGEGDRDLRMREMTSEEGASLERYADMTRGIMNLKRSLNNLITFEKKAIDPSDPYELDFSKHKTKIEDNIKKLEAMRAKSAPKWWSE